MTEDTKVETGNLETDVDWLKLERNEGFIGHFVWLGPAITFSAIVLIRVIPGRFFWAGVLFVVPFLTALCFDFIRSVYVELKDTCCRLDRNLKTALAELERSQGHERRDSG
ncbi:MAG: hypothetical protein ACYTEQ_28965 [Planctomycetota bacterium]|jgi:hypothetical protein